MVASLRVEPARKELMVQERRRHIVPWKPRPGVVDSDAVGARPQRDRFRVALRIQHPAGDKKAAARNLDDHVHADPHRLLQGRHRVASVKSLAGLAQDAQGLGAGGGTCQPVADMGRNVRRRQEHPAIVDIEASPAILRPEEQLLKLLRVERRSARIEHSDEAPALAQKVAPLDGGRTKLGGEQIVMRDEHAHLFRWQVDRPALEKDLAGVDRTHDLDPAVVPGDIRQDRQGGRHPLLVALVRGEGLRDAFGDLGELRCRILGDDLHQAWPMTAPSARACSAQAAHSGA